MFRITRENKMSSIIKYTDDSFFLENIMIN
jgi:hypothetical protein